MARNIKHWRMNVMGWRDKKSKHKMLSFPSQCLTQAEEHVAKIKNAVLMARRVCMSSQLILLFIFATLPSFILKSCSVFSFFLSLSLTRTTKTTKRVQKKESKVQRGLSSHFVSCCRLRYFLCSLSSSSLRCHAMRSVRKLRVSLTIVLWVCIPLG